MQIDWSTLPHWTNDSYKPLYKDWSRFLVIFGGSGSGKSYFITQRAIFRMLTIPGYNLLVTRKFGVTNRFSTFALFKQVISHWNLSSLFVVNKSEMTITALPTGNQVLFLGLDDPEKIKSITFQTGILQAVWCEEASELAESDLMQINLRLRGVSKIPFQIVVSFNPISAMHWLKTYFFDNPPPGTKTVKTTYRDNRFIDDAYREQLENLKGTAKAVYADGEWGVTEGLVFQQFKIADIPENAKLLGYGLDFGYSADPCALVAWWQRGDDIWLDQTVYRTGLTNPDLSKLMQSAGVPKLAKIVCDSAEPKSIEDLHRAGWNVHPAKKGPDSVRYGIEVIQQKNIHLTPRSTDLQKEFYSYTWKQDKNGRYLPEPVDCFNHGIDAARYFAMDLSKPTPRASGLNLYGR